MTAAEAQDLPRELRPAPPQRRVPRRRRPELGGPDGPRVAATDLLRSLLAEPLGQVSASVYETGRMVTLAPWLLGHRERIVYLLTNQREDGGWGGPGGYALVPTMSATEALLTTLARTADGAEPVTAITSLRPAAERGLAALSRWLGEPASALPDMPAIELIVPALVTAINRHLTAWSGPEGSGRSGPLSWTGRLSVPAGMRAEAPAAIGARLRAGHAVSEKLHHALEVVGADATRAAGIRPGAAGFVGASPAATAAWLGTQPPPPGDPTRLPLEQLVRRTGGPVPCAAPITVFERAWVLSALARNEVPVRPPAELLSSLDQALGPRGAAGGAGLPPDADSTSATLFVLARFGWFRSAEYLREFELDSHFCTWPGEEGMSPTVNAHVLEALGSLGGGHGSTVRKVASWLRERQHDDGNWSDRWHASPYYATVSCVQALHRSDPGASRAAIERASAWLCRSQHEDGSWGRWGGTAEETGYALQALLTCPPVDAIQTGRPWREVIANGREYLRRQTHRPTEQPALWHDKDLYRPSAIITAELLGVNHRIRTDPRLTSSHENE